jgi:hypothetical protein
MKTLKKTRIKLKIKVIMETMVTVKEKVKVIIK